MQFIKHITTKKLKFFLLSVTFITLGIILSVFLGHRIFDKEDNFLSDINSNVNISLNKVHQTSTRNGVMEWSLDATSANYLTKEKHANLKDLSVTFYLKDKTEVNLTANQGILKTDSNDIEVKGNVVVKHKGYNLKTEKLSYKDNDHMMLSQAPVKITGDSLVLTADSMSLNLKNKETLLQGKVEGILVGKIIF
jgi:LPS export ABC transporter protein LptC